MVVSAFSYFQYREISTFCQVEDCATHFFFAKKDLWFESNLRKIEIVQVLFKLFSEKAV